MYFAEGNSWKGGCKGERERDVERMGGRESGVREDRGRGRTRGKMGGKGVERQSERKTENLSLSIFSNGRSSYALLLVGEIYYSLKMRRL